VACKKGEKNTHSVYYSYFYNFVVRFCGALVFNLNMYYYAMDSADLAVDYLYRLVNSWPICNTCSAYHVLKTTIPSIISVKNSLYCSGINPVTCTCFGFQ
jgi:hypothetical protein